MLILFLLVLAIASHSSANSDDIKIVQNIFLAVGKCEVVQEKLMSVTTAIAGSGPAFVSMLLS